MKIKKVYIEPICRKYEHNVFIKEYLRNKKIDSFYSDKELSCNVLEKTDSYKGVVSIVNILKEIRNHEKIDLVFLSIDKKYLLICVLLSFLKRVNSIVIIPHGILNEIYIDTLVKSRIKSFLKKILFFTRLKFILTVFLLNKKNKIVVLGSSIKKNLVKLTNISYEQILTINHPYRYGDIPNTPQSNDKIIIGFIGVANKDKGFDILISALSHLANSKFKFVHVGPKNNKFSYENISTVFRSNELVSDKEFKNEISKLDYIILPLPDSEYKLRASGTFFDAVNFEKPIIYTSNDFIESYVKDLNVGYKVDLNDSKFTEVIDKNHYHLQKNNIKILKEILKNNEI
ncbi:hypothetical protein [Photobacterium damselae]|uniref:hypothetical protein n=1 Tax=Photobacterium damselae TaxID=38293 RepID=UPI002543F0E9